MKKKTFSYICYRIVRWLVKLFSPKFSVEGLENLPDDPCIIVGNHTHMYSPIACEIYFPGNRAIWCAGQMMHLKEVPAYAFADFWSVKPKSVHWFYKLLSYIIAPISVCIFNNAHTIAVYRDSRGISTFKNTANALAEGSNVIIFPEHAEKHNHIVNDFQDKFIDCARIYYKRTGKQVSFVPLYCAPRLKKLYLGKPIPFCADAPIGEERRRICDTLMDSITEIAVNLPRHIVIPYNNDIPKKDYPLNISPKEDSFHEKTRS